MFGDGVPPDVREPGDGRMLVAFMFSNLMDDLGIWCNYGLFHREFRYCFENGVFERVLPAAEFNSIPWDLLRNKDPRWLEDILTRIAYKRGEISHLGDGAYHTAQRWNLGMAFWDSLFVNAMTYNGYPQHHDFGTGAQAAIFNVVYNRDCMVHTLTNFYNAGMPFEIVRGIIDGHFGQGSLDPPSNFTRTNESKMRLAKWCLLRKQWHDMSTLCDWMWPMTLSPSRRRGYSGDIELDAKFMTAITGDNWSDADVLFAAEKVTQMLRAMTAISFRIHENSSNLRRDHDAINAHYFDRTPHLEPFTPGNRRMERADMERTLDLFYDAMGWDRVTGIPTRATLNRFGLSDMANRLAQHGILPA